MKHSNGWYLLGLILAIVSLPVKSDAPVWKVSKGDYQLYIGGTIHMLARSDYPLPAAFDVAYERASELVLETDMQEIESPAFQRTMMQAMSYSDETTLQQVLQPRTYAMLEAYLARYGVPIENLAKLRPGMVMLTLSMLELQRLGLDGNGVDSFYSQRARNDHKTLVGLETAQQQLEFIKLLGEGKEDALIIHTLEDIKQMPELMQVMKSAWREGDNNTLDSVAIKPWKDRFPDLYQALLVRRNQAWLPLIEAMLTTQDVELVLVGALHLVGDEGVLAMLAKRGYTVEQLPGTPHH